MMDNCSTRLSELIVSKIRDNVAQGRAAGRYRRPLVAFVSARSPKFVELCTNILPGHMMPEEVLPGAESVVSFFVPFEPASVQASFRPDPNAAPQWIRALMETDDLIDQIIQSVKDLFAEYGIRAEGKSAMDDFDAVSLASRWSHKSIAVIAGLGSFGLHRMVITGAGCAGRFASLVVDCKLPESQSPSRPRCLYFHDGSCRQCIRRCPAGALSDNGLLKRDICYSRHLEVTGPNLKSNAPICSKCLDVPCAFKPVAWNR